MEFRISPLVPHMGGWAMPVKLDPHEWIRQTREDRGLRQTDVERQSVELGLQLKISQSHLSKIEKGHSPLAGLGALKLDALRQILGVDPDEWVEKTGLELVTAATSSPRRPGPPVSVAPVVPFRETPITIPSELQEMVEKHGDAYPVLKTEQMQRMLAAPRNFGGAEVGPQTAEDWFDYWMANKRFLT